MATTKTTAAKPATSAAAKPVAAKTTSAKTAAAKAVAKAPAKTAGKAPAKSAAKAAAPVAPVAPEYNFTKRYKMLTGIDDSSFCDKVVIHLNNGYELYGSPTATFNGKNVIVGQAVVLKKLPKKNKK